MVSLKAFVAGLFLVVSFIMMPGGEAFAANDKVRLVGVVTAPAEMREIETVIEAVGTTKARRSVEIQAISSGVVREIAFTESEPVSKGSVLLRLDDEIERADLSEAEARLKDVKSSLQRSLSLQKRDAVSASSVDTLIAEVSIAEAERDRARRKLQDRILIAPFDGRIGFTDLELGAHLKADETVAVLDDLSSVKVEFYLPENLFSKIQVGAPIFADTAAFKGRSFKGNIEAIDSRVNENSRSFKVRALITNEDGLLPAGMFMHIKLVLDASTVLGIPEEAVVVDGTQLYVFVVDEEQAPPRAVQQTIKIGRRAFGWVEVIDGLNEGQKVIVRGVQKVKTGTALKILPLKSESATQ
ncbi:MAG: efflux RND transporter periplasmic adaptor subunit [Methylocystaceae bacterium]|nr:efflux RND transporter periplasmic adaptor subunit [Methylocystaceae bacterium]